MGVLFIRAYSHTHIFPYLLFFLPFWFIFIILASLYFSFSPFSPLLFLFSLIFPISISPFSLSSPLAPLVFFSLIFPFSPFRQRRKVIYYRAVKRYKDGTEEWLNTWPDIRPPPYPLPSHCFFSASLSTAASISPFTSRSTRIFCSTFMKPSSFNSAICLRNSTR